MNNIDKVRLTEYALLLLSLGIMLLCLGARTRQADDVTRVTLTPRPIVLPLAAADADEAAPDRALPGPTYILNLGTGKFHEPGCGHADRIDERNRVETGETREELIEQGFEPCGLCRP